MPAIEIRGLRGLKGLNSLSPNEYNAFMKANANKLNKYDNPYQMEEAANILYMNQKFIDTFGKDAFDQMNDGTEASFNLRNKGLFDYKVRDTFKKTFGKDSNYQEMSNELDAEAMYSLLNNDEYMGPTKRKQLYNTHLNAARKTGQNLDKMTSNPYIPQMVRGGLEMEKTAQALAPEKQDNEYLQKDENILKGLYAETQRRRENEIKDAADALYVSMLNDDTSGKKSLAQYYKEFDNFAMKNSFHYNTFKDSKWLKDYSNEDRLKDYAKYMALKQRYGEGVAINYFERSMQNKVAEAQDGSWTGNTLKGLLTTTWSDLGSNVALFANMGKSADEMAILNQGKDPNKPIYDKKGNIVDYQRNEGWVTNPAYWNNVYKYNTFSPTEIKAIEERGGVSKDVNVREYDYTPDFLSWDTVEEGFKQGGHVGAALVETALTGGLGKAIGWAGKGLMNVIGLSAKASATAARAGRIANNLLVGATTGLEGSQLEAMGTFDDQMQTAREKIQRQVKEELHDYQRSIDYNSKAVRLGVDNIYRQLKAKDKQRVALGNREGTTALPLSDETLRAQAKQLYTNQLLDTKLQELQKLHKKDEIEAAKAAQKAYTTNFWMDYVKNIPLTLGIQKYKIAKGSMRSVFDNTVKENVIADATTGGVKRTAKRYASGKQLGIEMAKQLGGGFMDEYMDGLNASFASGVGNNEFDNYIKRTYDPKAYNSTVDTFFGNLLAGMSEGIEGITDRQNLYEGFIGMVSPLTTVTPNINTVFRPKDTWRAVVGGTDAYNNKLEKIDRISTILMNPLLNTIVEAREKDKNIDTAIDAINSVIASNKDKLHDAAKVISVLDNYNGELAADKGDSPYTLLDAKDGKLLNTFTLINVLNGLENMDGGTGSYMYQDTMRTIEGLANGTLTEEEHSNEVDKFLGDENNKSILDLGEKGREIAAERLQANAKYFIEMKQKVSEIERMFANSPSMKNVSTEVRNILAYNLVASEDYEKRLHSLENELGLRKSDTNASYTPNYSMIYYTQEAKTRAIQGREHGIKKTIQEQEKLKENTKKLKEKAASLREDLKWATDTEERAKIKADLNRQQNMIDANNFKARTLDEKKALLAKEKEEITKAETNSGFDMNTILNADARDRAAILDPSNRDNYPSGIAETLDNIVKNLQQKDPEALTKIKDAELLAQRIDDMKTVYSKILHNDKLASAYLTTVSAARERAALSESLQKDISTYYKNINAAYHNREIDGAALKNTVLNMNPELIEAYMEDNANQVDVLRPYYEILKFDMDAAAIINMNGYSKETRKEAAKILARLSFQSESREELEKKVEGIIDSPDVDADLKVIFERLMENMVQIGYQRNATIVEDRKKRKEREEAEKAKKEAERKKEEEEKKKIEKEVPVDGSNVEQRGEFEKIPSFESDGSNESSETNGRNESNGNLESDGKKELENEGENKKEENKREEKKEEEKEKKENIGSFAEKKGETEMKAREDTNKKATESENAGSENLIAGEDAVQGKSENLKEQYEETEDAVNDGKEMHLSDSNASEDADEANGIGEHTMDNSFTALSGNGMSVYEPKPLQEDGVLKRKEGERDNDNMNTYYAWMDAAGIKLQNIIDHELARIIEQNPEARVKFMSVKPESNASNDVAMQTHLMLVLDYDDSINKGITGIHDDQNWGVISSDGKKYLVIGVAGFRKGNSSQLSLYDMLWNPKKQGGLNLKAQRKQFFDKHPNERYYVNEELSTEIVPQSQIPGYIVRQAETDRNPEFRSVLELLSDTNRNPQHYDLDTVAWGIQEATQFLIIGAPLSKVMVPRNKEKNMGSAFVLMPASNGKLVPSYLKVLKYVEMRDGSLKERTNRLLQEAVSPDYNVGIEAIKKLSNIFYFDKDGDTLLRRKSRNEISLVHDGKVQKIFVLDSSFDRAEFMKAMEDMNPRVNVTARVLKSEEQLREYDEAGALMTDAAMFGTAGSSYSIYGLDGEGKMIKREAPLNTQTTASESSFRDNRSQVIYKHQYYREANGEFSLNGEPVKDENLIRQLQQIKRIIDNKINPSLEEGVYQYYVLSAGEHPEAIKIHRNTKEVTEATEKQAKELIEKIRRKEEEERRKMEAEKVLKQVQLEEKQNGEIEEEQMIGNDVSSGNNKSNERDERNGNNENNERHEEKKVSDEKVLRGTGGTQTFTQLYKNNKYEMRLLKLIRGKWKEAPVKMSELEKFLKARNIETDCIGMSKEDIEAWIKTVEDCR